MEIEVLIKKLRQGCPFGLDGVEECENEILKAAADKLEEYQEQNKKLSDELANFKVKRDIKNIKWGDPVRGIK